MENPRFVNLDCPSGWRTSDGYAFSNRFRDYVVEIFDAKMPLVELATENVEPDGTEDGRTMTSSPTAL